MDYKLLLHAITNSNMTSFFRFVDIDGLISFAHVPVNVTDFSNGAE
jgi:hypothetical protein